MNQRREIYLFTFLLKEVNLSLKYYLKRFQTILILVKKMLFKNCVSDFHLFQRRRSCQSCVVEAIFVGSSNMRWKSCLNLRQVLIS